jgi:two-component system nitrate/nitrite response regulator NarL
MTPGVLLVDDDPTFRRIARELLVDRGYRVIGEAATGQAAVDAAAALTPDAVLLDINLPDADGFAVAQRLSTQGRAILLTSSDPSFGSDPRVARCGARAFVPKAALVEVDLRHYLGPR